MLSCQQASCKHGNLPDDSDGKIENDEIEPIHLIYADQGLLGNDNAHHHKDKGVGQISKHLPKPKVKKGKGRSKMTIFKAPFLRHLMPFSQLSHYLLHTHCDMYRQFILAIGCIALWRLLEEGKDTCKQIYSHYLLLTCRFTLKCYFHLLYCNTYFILT